MGTVQVWEVKDAMTLAMVMSTYPNAVVTVAHIINVAPFHAGCASHGYAEDYFRSQERAARKAGRSFSYLVFRDMRDFSRASVHQDVAVHVCTICGEVDFK